MCANGNNSVQRETIMLHQTVTQATAIQLLYNIRSATQHSKITFLFQDLISILRKIHNDSFHDKKKKTQSGNNEQKQTYHQGNLLMCSTWGCNKIELNRIEWYKYCSTQIFALPLSLIYNHLIWVVPDRYSLTSTFYQQECFT